MSRNKFYAVAGLLALVLAVAIGIIVWQTQTEEQKNEFKRVFGINLGPQAQEIVKSIQQRAHNDKAEDVHVSLRNEAPPGSPLFQDPEAQAKALIRGQQEAMQGTSGPDEVIEPQTLAEASQRGCRSGPWVVNKSSRDGARPDELTAHLTVSHNVPGWADVNAIVAWFNNTRSQASSNYVIDSEGNCAYIVNEAFKAWTQGFFNPWSISIEFIHFSPTSTSEKWTETQLRKGALVFADAHKRWGIPIKLVNPNECNTPAGVTDHDRLECGNEHVDVGTKENGTGVHRGTFPMTHFVFLIHYFTWPPCTVINVKKKLNTHEDEHFTLAHKFGLSSVYSPRAQRVMTRFKEAHGLSPNSGVSANTGKVLHLRGCNGSIQ